MGSISNYGSAVSANNDEINDSDWVLELEDIEGYSSKLLVKERKGNQVIGSTKHRFQKGDLLVSKLRMYLKKVLVADEDGFCSSEIMPTSFLPFCQNKFAKLFYVSPYLLTRVDQLQYGCKMPRLGTKDGRNLLFPLPPEKEQRRIVRKAAEIDSLLIKIETLTNEIQNLSLLLKKKVLSIVFSSDKSYYEIGKAGKLISGRDLSSSQYGSKGKTPYLTGASNFVHGTVQTNRYTDSPQVLSYEGDVLITCKGTIGKTAINPFRECHIARQIMAFRCGEAMINEYCQYFLMAKASDLQWASSSLIPGFDRNDFLGLKYPHKTIGEQKRICHTLNKTFATIGFIVEGV